MVCDPWSRWASETGSIKQVDSEANISPLPRAESDHAARRRPTLAALVHCDCLSTVVRRVVDSCEAPDPETATSTAHAGFFLTLPLGTRARALLPPPPVYGSSVPLIQRCLWFILIRTATSATNPTTARGLPTLLPVGIFSAPSESPVPTPSLWLTPQIFQLSPEVYPVALSSVQRTLQKR
jgi:hypothetical protein